jgi:hypothetical protein
VARVVADFMPSKWALELLGGLTDLDPAVVEQSLVFNPENQARDVFDHPFADAFNKPLVWRWLVLSAFTAAFLSLTTWVQFRKGRS